MYFGPIYCQKFVFFIAQNKNEFFTETTSAYTEDLYIFPK
jgi:hypothetical protein